MLVADRWRLTGQAKRLTSTSLILLALHPQHAPTLQAETVMSFHETLLTSIQIVYSLFTLYICLLICLFSYTFTKWYSYHIVPNDIGEQTVAHIQSRLFLQYFKLFESDLRIYFLWFYINNLYKLCLGIMVMVISMHHSTTL